ncbi:hypothetical protein I0C86_41535 [Plantactinospora sp. S1510]|uniref:DUF2842 domain-containing protein n=1 Tax=Plantactinospora alkalitolerans TaxID=2789879 RepID=A0ABS0HA26_9ACTN|nr:hypothetical protein [Plantactinospora alkalitolerans]MBF9135336.1 hypothetical protein [Plantactinospora alkalitolerans]
MTTARTRPEQVRDLIMMLTLLIWIVYAGAAVTQLFTSGAKVLDSLPPFWFWGIPLAPYSALYTPWQRAASGASGPPAPPEAGPPVIAPNPPPEPEAAP